MAKSAVPKVEDEPGAEERFRRGLKNALSTPNPRLTQTLPQVDRAPLNRGKKNDGRKEGQ